MQNWLTKMGIFHTLDGLTTQQSAEISTIFALKFVQGG